MSLFKRTFTGIYHKVDQLVGEIENHDAQIQAAIGEQKNTLAAAKVQLQKIRHSEQKIKDQLAELSIDEHKWAQRATQEAKSDEHRALTCLQRRQRIRQQKTKLEHMLYEYQLSSTRIKRDVEQCEDTLENMIQKHQILRARQSTADALRIIDRESQTQAHNVESSFDRWEVKIAQGEYTVDKYDSEIDELEQAYLSEENELELRAELAELLKDNAIQTSEKGEQP